MSRLVRGELGDGAGEERGERYASLRLCPLKRQIERMDGPWGGALITGAREGDEVSLMNIQKSCVSSLRDAYIYIYIYAS